MKEKILTIGFLVVLGIILLNMSQAVVLHPNTEVNITIYIKNEVGGIINDTYYTVIDPEVKGLNCTYQGNTSFYLVINQFETKEINLTLSAGSDVEPKNTTCYIKANYTPSAPVFFPSSGGKGTSTKSTTTTIEPINETNETTTTVPDKGKVPQEMTTTTTISTTTTTKESQTTTTTKTVGQIGLFSLENLKNINPLGLLIVVILIATVYKLTKKQKSEPDDKTD